MSDKIARLITLLIVTLAIYYLAVWTDNNIEWLLWYMKGEAVAFPNWVSLLITFVFNGLILAFNLIMEFIKLVL